MIFISEWNPWLTAAAAATAAAGLRCVGKPDLVGDYERSKGVCVTVAVSGSS